jgi:CDP-diacylglycerol--glycerol-3-phosphate 3-phosphatidyltransferase
MLFNAANNLTLARVAVVPLLVVMLSFPGRIMSLAAMLLFVFAAVTDIFDGFIARRLNLVTTLGKFLDLLADKILVATVLIMLAGQGVVPAWVAVVIVCREIAVTGLRAVAADLGVVIAADAFGKLKTVLQALALCPLILHFPLVRRGPGPFRNGLLYAALVLTVGSGINYFLNFYGVMARGGR